MYSYHETYINKALLVLFFLAVVGYGYFELRGLLYGPQIHIGIVPESTTEQFIIISGTIDHTTSLSINGKDVTVTQDGQFHYPYLLAPGNNQVFLDARDKYGSIAHKVVQVVYNTLTPLVPPTPIVVPSPVATSTTLIQ